MLADPMAERDERIRNSSDYRDAAADLDFWAVVLIGPRSRVPRTWSDNEGVWPVRVGLSQNPEDYAARIDLDAGAVHEHVALTWVWTASKRHATRLKTRLDHLLLGDIDANRLRHGWRNVNDPDIDWPILLGDALEQIMAAGEIVEVFDGDEKHRRTLSHMMAFFRGKRRSAGR